MSENNKVQPPTKSTEVGLMIAGAVAPRSFQASLMPRDTIDQSVVTGASMSVGYGVTSLIQDVLDGLARELAEDAAKNNGEDGPTKLDYEKYSAGLSIAATIAGLVIEYGVPKRADEKLTRAGVRSAGRWLKLTGIAGTISSAVNIATEPLVPSRKNGHKHPNYFKLLVIPIGAAIAMGLEFNRRRKFTFEADERQDSFSPVKSLAIGSAVAAGLGLFGVAEKTVAHKVNDALGHRIPLLSKLGLPLGHAIALGASGYGMYELFRKVYQKVEQGSETLEDAFHEEPTDSYSSAGPKSIMRWKNLSLQGRRHIASRLSAEHINDVMRIKNAKEPIRLYVGFYSARHEEERVELALKELKKMGAYDRKYLAVISPTGTGYVNYQMSESLEYFTRGDVASIAIQYSLRPSPMSLDQVSEGRVQYRMLLNGIRRELAHMPESKRPKIVLFGESLGAWTSQDAFVNQGTDGLGFLDIYRALWIGTPNQSRWMQQVTSRKKRLDTDYEKIGKFNDFGQFQKLSKTDQADIRYVMVTHDNDGVARFSPDLIIKEPDWLGNPEERPRTIPKTTEYRSIITFFQTVIDMKNALKPEPGVFKSDGHDYSADLAEFVNAVYTLGASEAQISRVEKALRQNDVARARALGEI